MPLLHATEANDISTNAINEAEKLTGLISNAIRKRASMGHRSLYPMRHYAELHHYSKSVLDALVGKLKAEGYRVTGSTDDVDWTVSW